jgi:hypothetical protein
LGIRLYPMALIIMSLLILVLPGAIFNVYATDGFKSADPALTCPGGADVTCQGSITEGCQAVATQCSLNNGLTVSLLNQNSPFTALLSGNLGGLWQFLNGQGTTTSGAFPQGPFDIGGSATQGTYYVAQCAKNNVAAHPSVRLFVITQCTQMNPSGNQNVTKAAAVRLTNWNTGANQANEVVTTPFYNLNFGPNGSSYNFNCALVGQGTSVTGFGSSNHTSDLNGYTYFGCDLYKGANPNIASNPWFSVMVAIPNTTSQSMGANYQHFTAFFIPVAWEAYICGLAGYQPTLYLAYQSPQCTNFFNSLNRWTVDAAGNTFNGGILAPLITFVIGMALLLLGLGINFQVNGSFFGSGAGLAVGSNTQGTKLAQIIGLALLTWSPLYSEFSTWFTSGLLPFGLDGSITAISSGSGVIALVLTGMFFLGVVWQGQSLE